MPWSLGTFTRLFNWQQDQANSINILSSRMDGEDDNFAAGLNNCLTKDGTNQATADLNVGNHKITNMAVGTAAADAATLGQVQSLQGQNGPQLVTNGQFAIAQLGTSFANPAAGARLMDRWRLYLTGGTLGTATISQDTAANGFPTRTAAMYNGSIFNSCLKWVTTVVGTGTCGVEQRIENPQALDNQKFGLLIFFNVGGDGNNLPSASYGVNFGTGGSPSATIEFVMDAPTLLASANSGQEVALQFLGNSALSLAGKTFGSNGDAYFFIRIWDLMKPGRTGTKYLSGVSLLMGAGSAVAPTTYRPLPMQQEVAIAERYFEKSFAIGTTPADNTAPDMVRVGSDYFSSGHHIVCPVPYRVRKRVAPTVTFFSPALGTPSAGQPSYTDPADGNWYAGSGAAVTVGTEGGFSAQITPNGAHIPANSAPMAFNWTAADSVF